jgi:hypothetical protein
MTRALSLTRSRPSRGVRSGVPEVRDVHAPPYTPAADEAFGQSGVRQHLGRAINWACVTLLLISLAMWARSVTRSDEFAYRSFARAFTVQSVQGRMLISSATYPSRQFGNTGWMYRPRSVSPRMRDRWPPSIYKTIGFEMRLSPLNASAASGFWLQVKWYFLAVVFAVVPAVRLVQGLLASRSEAR